MIDGPAHMEKRLADGMYPSYRRLTRGDWLELRHATEYYQGPSELPSYARVDRRVGALYNPDDGDQTIDAEMPVFQTVEDHTVAPAVVDGFCPPPPAHPVRAGDRELEATVDWIVECITGDVLE